MPRLSVAKACLMACQNNVGQGLAGRLLVTGKAMHCSWHAKSNGGHGKAHDMPKQGLAKAWQAYCLSPSKAMRSS
ncbi:hypothetical protein RHGRI_001441 [Rhododendron griersonianum]|uniref:Uncharacterized protein n=1 Tax=Rhododendron griersonianum TaxID=479676 RepID=A0AAV6LK68_9ERIC|nr:hypothetical protein RHGRI_001441 [Rhododendron griersonianum]